LRILGINSVFHESAAALIVDGRIVAAAEEERFTRVKHAKPARVDNPDVMPVNSIRFCLGDAGLMARDLDAVAYSFDPALRRREFALDPDSLPGDWGDAAGERVFLDKLNLVRPAIEALLERPLGDKLRFVPHHLAHAASSFYPSGMEKAAILVVDGIGEAGCTTLALGDPAGIKPLRRIFFPHSIGFVWEKLSAYLGFSEYDASKAMGLAAYGDPDRLALAFQHLMGPAECGYRVDPAVARFRVPEFAQLEALFGPRRLPGCPILDHHRDLAAALQAATDRAVLAIAEELRAMTCCAELCLAGGVALNCVSNTVVKERAGFERVFVPPAPHDGGTAIGAGLHLDHRLGGKPAAADHNPYLGPAFGPTEIAAALDAAGLEARRSHDPARDAAAMIAAGKIVAWFQGRMEFGPRALGNRSLLADPRNPAMRDIMNRKVKHREAFRPFAPSALAEEAHIWFDIGRPSVSHAYMLFACPARPERREQIPAVLHVDGSARLQLVDRALNPRFYALISHFHALTGVPVVLNTSFNDNEPIVCSPADAIATFRKTAIDALVLEDFIVTREGS
jgi:carbamoyltransferase